MNVFDLFAKLSLDSSEYDSGLDKAKSAGSALGKGIASAAKVGIAAVGAAAAGIGALGTATVKEYANYEQLVGGVETLFGAQGMSLEEYADSVGESVNDVRGKYNSLMNAQNTMMENAKNAYRSAGLSANEYMETATSFAASLVSSLGGDTEMAAQMADMAIVDMSDNANKMGTSMESIQNAYQGFAKQNYTMLDNLKLGYGGTKEEMQRLLEDAEAISGIEYDISSYADVVDAIHVIQNEMGIAGTTAKEAEQTISGSLGMLKSSWMNLVAGLGNKDADIGALIENVVSSAETALNNIIPIAEQALSGAADLVVGLAPIIGEKIPALITELLPKIIEASIQLIEALGKGILDNLPIIIDTAVLIVTNLVDAFTQALPKLIKGGGKLLDGIIRGIAAQLPVLIPMAFEIIGTLIKGLLENPGAFLELAEVIVTGICDGLEAAFPQLSDAFQFLEDAINGVFGWILNNGEVVKTVLAAILGAFLAFEAVSAILKAVEVATTLVSTAQGILNAVMAANPIMLIVMAISALVAAFIYLWNTSEEFRAFWIDVWEGVKSTFDAVWEGIINFFTVSIPNAISNILGFLAGMLDSIIQWGANLKTTITEGAKTAIENFLKFFSELPSKVATFLSNAISKIIDFKNKLIDRAREAARGFFENIVNKVSEIPSKLGELANNMIDALTSLPDKFLEIGGNVVKGLWEGIKNGWDWLVSSVKDLADSLFEAAKDALGIASPSKKFRWIGEMVDDGLALGITSNLDDVKSAMDSLVSEVDMPVNGSAFSGINGAYGGFNQYLTINSPRELNPSEVARQTRNANREMILRLRTT